MVMRKFWIVLFVIALTACKSQAVVSKDSSGKQPDWVNGDSFNYPHSAYIVGKASASNRETAKNRALANLSKTFELKIQEESKTLSDVRSRVANGKESYTKDSRITQNIKIETDKVLEGARVAELWQDKKLFEFHALAVLERSQAGRNIRQQMSKLDQATESELKRARSNADKLLAMAAMNQAFKQQLERQSLQKTLKIIDLKGVGKPSSWNLADMRAELESQLLALKISNQIDSSDLTQLKRLVKGAMSKAGFPAVNRAADYKLVATSKLTDVGMRSGWYWVRGKITVKLTEAGSGKVRGTHTWSFKSSANSKDVAVSRLVTKADKAMKNDMKKVILDFATSVGS